jgi:hypothetical protein
MMPMALSAVCWTLTFARVSGNTGKQQVPGMREPFLETVDNLVISSI